MEPSLRQENTAEEGLSELMQAYQGGSVEAFEALFARLATPLKRYLRSLAPPGADADDLVQTTFLQIHRSRASHLPGLPVRPWVFAIARNVAAMARRGSARRAKRETLAPDDLPELPIPPEALSRLDRIELRRALATIGEGGREAAWLHHVQGFSFREVAAIQGISETAAKVRAHRALRALRELLDGGDA